MALKTRSNPMGALGTKMYTLTVNTDPSSATCTLTYDGVAHTEKSAEVKAGTVISYSIYHSTYGTTTGSITMTANKTLTCNGTYSTSSSNVSYTVPTLTSSTGNGTLGGSSFAISPSKQPLSGKEAWHAFDGIYGSKAGNEWQLNQYNDLPGWLIMYFPYAVSITKIGICNDNSGFKNGTVDYSSNGSSWTTKKTWTNTNYNPRQTWYINSIGNSSDSKYKYWRLYFPKSSWNGTAYRPQIQEILITAYKSQTSYTYYWNKSIS